MNNTLKNSVQLIGNIGKEVEILNFENGNKKASVSIATTDYYTNNKGEKVKQTEWHNLIAWGKTAELMAQVLRKGNEVAIQGKLTNRSYTYKTGVTRYVTEIVVNEFYRISRNEKELSSTGEYAVNTVEEPAETLPF
jgi:single-strand DNA-binding protein